MNSSCSITTQVTLCYVSLQLALRQDGNQHNKQYLHRTELKPYTMDRNYNVVVILLIKNSNLHKHISSKHQPYQSSNVQTNTKHESNSMNKTGKPNQIGWNKKSKHGSCAGSPSCEDHVEATALPGTHKMSWSKFLNALRNRCVL